MLVQKEKKKKKENYLFEKAKEEKHCEKND
jgi:hypothetical protein